MLKNYFEDKSIVLTGGCGFIGANLFEQLLEFKVKEICVIDNLSAGTSNEFLHSYIDDGLVQFYKIDISEKNSFKELIKITEGFDIIIHLAAQPSVPISVEKPIFDFEMNVVGSMALLEIARINAIKEFVFAASGGTVYGDALVIPTDELHMLKPISNYGAAKAAFEMYLSSYSYLYGIKCTSLRFGNVFGKGSTHGVIHDFFLKLQNDPSSLEILGNGKQSKSYLNIADCIRGFVIASSRPTQGFEAFNMAGFPPLTVDTIADKICEILNIDPKYMYTGDKGGWKGDVVKGELDCAKLKDLGWKPLIKFEEGLKDYLVWLATIYKP